MEATHEQLISVCPGFDKYLKSARIREKLLKSDKAGKLKWLPDCSCGCKYYHELSGTAGQDWGVCWNKKSPRAGKLTFEHMERCKLFCQEA